MFFFVELIEWNVKLKVVQFDFNAIYVGSFSHMGCWENFKIDFIYFAWNDYSVFERNKSLI